MLYNYDDTRAPWWGGNSEEVENAIVREIESFDSKFDEYIADNHMDYISECNGGVEVGNDLKKFYDDMPKVWRDNVEAKYIGERWSTMGEELAKVS